MKIKLLSMLLSFTLLAGSMNVPGIAVTGGELEISAETRGIETLEKTELETFHERVAGLQEAYAPFEATVEEDAVFRTGRLLAESAQAFDTHGAAEVLQYRDLYVLRYDTLESAKAAYEALQEERVKAVPDVFLGDLEKIKAEPKETVQEEGEFVRFQTELLERTALSGYLTEHLSGNTEGNRKIVSADRTCLDVLGQDAGDGVQAYTNKPKTGEGAPQSLVENYIAMMELEAGEEEAGAVLLSVKSSTVHQGTLFAGKIRENLDAGKVILFPVMDEAGNLTGYEYAKELPAEGEVKEEAEGGMEEEQEPENREEEKKEEGQESKAKAGHEAAEALQEEQKQEEKEKQSETLESRELLNPKAEDAAGTMEKVEDTKAASDLVNTVIKLSDNETYDKNAKKDGYHIDGSKTKTETCHHDKDSCDAEIRCEGTGVKPDGSLDLNPSDQYLKSKVKFYGKLNNKKYKVSNVEFIDSNPPGIERIPVLKKLFHVTIEGAEGIDTVELAGVYTCSHADGDYKGFTYYRKFYSYCQNTKRFYHVGDAHYWLGCSAGDVGTIESVDTKYSHDIKIYKFVPNTYTVKFDANGGSGSMGSQKMTYDTMKDLSANKFKKTGYTFTGWTDSNGNTYTDKQKVMNLTKTNNGTVTLTAQWTPNQGTYTINANGGKMDETNGIHKYTNGSGKTTYFKLDNSGNLQSSASTTGFQQYSKTVKYNTAEVNLANVGTFGIRRTGYHLIDGKEYIVSGKTNTFDQDGDKGAAASAMKNLLGLRTKTGTTLMLKANWTANTYTIIYNVNGGSGTIPNQPAVYDKSLNLSQSVPTRTGYTFAGWKKDNIGNIYTKGQSVKNLTAIDGGKVTMYAQWTPNVYTVTLDNQLTAPENAGTKAIYEKYENGWYLNNGCTSVLKNRGAENRIVIPKKTGYKFLGYYNAATGGTQMIAADGKMTTAGSADYKLWSNTTWYAHYSYLFNCEDYADVPCDFKKTDGDTREDVGALLVYDKETRKVTVRADQAGFTASLTGKPSGTKVGQFKSVIAGGAASGSSGNTQEAVLSMVPAEGAAYQWKVTAGGKTICDRTIYFKDGRFRTLVKLGIQSGKKTRDKGGAIAGSDWGADTTGGAIYDLYKYISCSEIKNVSAPGTVYRYFTYKDVNMAYSGNGATSGTNILENDVSLENMYQFRENGFTKEKTMEKETADNETYECDVKYSFEGWKMSSKYSYQEQDRDRMVSIYKAAGSESALSTTTTEDIRMYQSADPIAAIGSIFSLNTAGNQKAAQNGFGTVLQNLGAGQHATEYINLLAQWNAFPTIVVTPGDSLEFYEGEEVTKDDLISHLTANDEEDNNVDHRPYIPDLNDKLRIVKVVYPESENGSQEAYEKTYGEDIPEDFLLDTYYLKLEKDEVVEVLVTFAVTDSNGNTTEEEIPVKVKYNNPPEIDCEDEYYYLKEEANRGEITAEALIGRAKAVDVEDGEEITEKLELVDFEPQELQMQTQYKEVFPVTYQVTDAYKKTTIRTVNVMVWDEDAYIAEQPKYYVRYISEKYLDTLEENSVWREPENMAYLLNVLKNTTPVETWHFTHEDVLAVQDWITENGDGHWKFGQEANREFRRRFGYCLQ